MKLLLGLVLVASVSVATPARADPATVAKFLEWFDSFANIAVTYQTLCRKMGTDMTKSLDDNKALLADVDKAMTAGEELPEDAQQHMTDTAKRLATAVAVKCDKDYDVRMALQRLPGRKHKSPPPVAPGH